MKKSLIALSGMAVFLTCSSISAIAAPPAEYPQSGSVSALLLADAAKPAAKNEAKSKEEAAKPVLTPVKVSVKAAEQYVEIEITGKAAVLGGYSASLQKRAITVSQAALAGPEQTIDLDKGLIKNVHIHELDGGKVVIDIYALSNPKIIQQAQGKKFLVSFNDMEDAKPKTEVKPAAASAPVKVKKEAASAKPAAKPAAAPAKPADKPAAKPAAAPAPAKSADKAADKKTEAKSSDSAQPAAADKETAPAAAPEPVPVAVKVNSGTDSVSFDVNWTGDVKVKEFPYNPGKGIHTFIFTPAVLSAPEGLVAVNKGTLQAIRTRQLDKQTVAVDVMASSAPNIKAQARQTPGASYTVRPAGVPAAASKPAAVPAAAQKKTEAKPAAADKPQAAPQTAPAPSDDQKKPEAKPAAADKPQAAPQTVPAPSDDQKKPEAKPAAADKPQSAPQAAPAPASSQTPAAAPKAASNVGAESGAPAKAGTLQPSERVCDYFTMAGRDVQSLVNSMKGLFPNVRFQADPVLNVILVEGPAKDIEEVRKLINIQ